MSDEITKEINKVAGSIYSGAVGERFEFVIEQISRIAVDYRIPSPIHKTINPMLNDMIRQLNSMKNNVMACMIGKDDTPMKVAQPTDADMIRSLYCDTCANKDDAHRCDVCVMLPGFDSRTRPSGWEPADCENKIEDLKSCPCCGSSRIHVVAPDDGCYCWDCGLTMPNRPDWRARWNRRVNE